MNARNKIGDIKIAEDLNYDDYDKISIDNFGKEMLYKMGWKDNQPLRKDGPIKPIEFKPRNSGLGLGAEPLESDTKKKKNEKTIKKNFYGTKVKIISGKHLGLKAKIVEKNIDDLSKFFKENKFVCVELKINKNIVKVKNEEIVLRKSKNKDNYKHIEEDKNKQIFKNKDKNTNKEHKPELTSKINSHNKSRSHSRSRSRKKEKKKLKPLKWVHQNIIVRIISKQNKYYNCKGVIEDLLNLTTFSLIMLDDKTVHTDFSEEDLETVVPKLNEDVLILFGEFRGESGKLIFRDKTKNKVSVQLYSDMNIYNFTQDDISALSK